MKHFRYRGKRIRPADKDLVFRSACCTVLPVFLIVFSLLNLKTILQTDWRRLSRGKAPKTNHMEDRRARSRRRTGRALY